MGHGDLFGTIHRLVELEMLKFKIEWVLHKEFDVVVVDLRQFPHEGSGNKSVFKPQPYFLAVAEDEVIEVVEDEFQRLGVVLVDLNQLADAAGVEGFIFDASEVPEDLLYFLLHQFQ